jgi:hypothetical protein
METIAIGTLPKKSKDTAAEEFLVEKVADMEAFKKYVEPIKVLYRASAAEKQLLVIGLKYLGIHEKWSTINQEEDSDKKYNLAVEAERVVSVTGEGIGDVDAIHEA